MQGAAPQNDMVSRFISGFDQGQKDAIIKKLMEHISTIYDPTRTTEMNLPQQPTPDIQGTPAGQIPQFFNSNIPPAVTTETPATRTDIAGRAMEAMGKFPQAAGMVDKLFGDYFKPETPIHGAIPEGGSFYAGGKVIPGMPKTSVVAPNSTLTQGGKPIYTAPSAPMVVGKDAAVVQPGAGPGGSTVPSYTNVGRPEAGMFDVQTDADGNVTVLRKDTGQIMPMGKIGKPTAGPARYHYGANAKGELVQVDTITGEQKAIPGVFGPEYLKMSFDQRNKSSDQLYSQLLEKFMAGQASQAELETLNMLTDMKSKQGILYMLQGASETGKFAGPPPRPWEQPKETPPPPKEKGFFDFLRPNAPDIRLEPETGAKPKFRQPGKTPGAAAPTAGGTSYKFSVGADSYSIRGPQGRTPEQVKVDVDQIGEALKVGIDLNTIMTEFEKNGYSITRPGGKSPGPNGVSETILKR